jgi:hypothetical protein
MVAPRPVPAVSRVPNLSDRQNQSPGCQTKRTRSIVQSEAKTPQGFQLLVHNAQKVSMQLLGHESCHLKRLGLQKPLLDQDPPVLAIKRQEALIQAVQIPAAHRQDDTFKYGIRNAFDMSFGRRRSHGLMQFALLCRRRQTDGRHPNSAHREEEEQRTGAPLRLHHLLDFEPCRRHLLAGLRDCEGIQLHTLQRALRLVADLACSGAAKHHWRLCCQGSKCTSKHHT